MGSKLKRGGKRVSTVRLDGKDGNFFPSVVTEPEENAVQKAAATDREDNGVRNRVIPR